MELQKNHQKKNKKEFQNLKNQKQENNQSHFQVSATITEAIYINMQTFLQCQKKLFKKKDTNLSWNKEQDIAFEDLKLKINSNIATFIPNLNKKFILTTDASNTGISAILQQENENGKLQVINWASKKLTEAEKKYSITEKECLGIVWGIEYFEYYLRGRKFDVITDHSAAVSMKNKKEFGRIKLERMRERIQDYDYNIIHRPGITLTNADYLSRIYQVTEDYDEREKRLKNIMNDSEGNLYIKNIKNQEYKLIPKIKDRQSLMKEVHEVNSSHRGRDSMLKELKKKYYWMNMDKSIQNFINNCLICSKNSQKNNGGETFITTSEPLEIMAADLFFLDQQNPILTTIDYFTRVASARILKSKEPKIIIKQLNDIFKTMGTPKTLITDNGKEFINKEFEKFLVDNNIIHHRSSPEKHQSNGRIERFHRTLWQDLKKSLNNNIPANIEKELEITIQNYNNSTHKGIKMSPNNAFKNPTNESLIRINSKYGINFKNMKKLKREEFKVNDKILIKNNTLTLQEKINPNFERIGKVKMKLDNDSYLIENNDKLIKRNHAHLKKLK